MEAKDADTLDEFDLEDLAASEELEPEEWEEESQPIKPGVLVLVFLGLIVAAAVICGVLWHFTHRGDGQEGQSSLPVATTAPTSQPASEPVATTEPTSQPTAEPEATAEPTSQPAAEPVATAEPTSQPTAEPAATDSASVQEPISGNETMTFTAVQETVMPKDVLNLRSLPSTQDSENVVAQAKNGEALTRIGINHDTGWSKIDYNGQTVYAVSQYLTTDLSYTPPVEAANPNRVSTKDGRVIVFTDCDDNVSPKEYVNLRLEPSTSEGNSTVHCKLDYGEVVHRTGYSVDSGWSRVEYDNHVLYVVTSLVYVVTE